MRAPTQTSMCVRSPASCSRSSRSSPIAPASAAATSRRSDALPERRAQAPRGDLRGLALRHGQLVDPAGGEVEQRVEQLARERVALGRRLHLDEPAVARHHDVHVGFRARVLGVVEVEQRHAVDDAHRDGRDRTGQRLREAEPVECPERCDIRAGDRGTAGAAVGLQHVAVEPERPLAQRLEVADDRERPADQALDLHRAAVLLASARRSLRPLARRRGQQRVLGGHPAAALAAQPARTLLLERRGAEHLRSFPARRARSRAAARGSRAARSSGLSSSAAARPDGWSRCRLREGGELDVLDACRSAAAGSGCPSRETLRSPVVRNL